MDDKLKTITITISGAQGTGKSMLANALYALLNQQGVPTSLTEHDVPARDDLSLEEPLEEPLEEVARLSLMPIEIDIVTTNAAPREHIADDLRDALKNACDIAEAQSKLLIAYRLQRSPGENVLRVLGNANERIANMRDDFGV